MHITCFPGPVSLLYFGCAGRAKAQFGPNIAPSLIITSLGRLSKELYNDNWETSSDKHANIMKIDENKVLINVQEIGNWYHIGRVPSRDKYANCR